MFSLPCNGVFFAGNVFFAQLIRDHVKYCLRFHASARTTVDAAVVLVTSSASVHFGRKTAKRANVSLEVGAVWPEAFAS